MFGPNALFFELPTGPLISPPSWIGKNGAIQSKLKKQPIIFRKIFSCGDQYLKYIIESTKELQADLIEIALLETLILCRKGVKQYFDEQKVKVSEHIYF